MLILISIYMTEIYRNFSNKNMIKCCKNWQLGWNRNLSKWQKFYCYCPTKDSLKIYNINTYVTIRDSGI
ncbi:MAG: hypothetical protein DRP56_00050 [Planctomycetota bacterium]|nr:MAG: hypothetical protein DRP56_00050 [Planctomycetota bacterium]